MSSQGIENGERVIMFLRTLTMSWMDMVVDVFPWTKPKCRNKNSCFVDGRRQHKCEQAHTDLAAEVRKRSFSSMDFSWSLNSPITTFLVHFVLVASLVCPVCSSEVRNHPVANQTFRPLEELHKLKTIRNRLQQINKPAVKTIEVPENLELFDFTLLISSCVFGP